MARDTAHPTRRTEQEPGGPGHRTRKASAHTGKQLPTGSGHRTFNTTHRASTPVNNSQVAQDTAHQAGHIERARR